MMNMANDIYFGFPGKSLDIGLRLPLLYLMDQLLLNDMGLKGMSATFTEEDEILLESLGYNSTLNETLSSMDMDSREYEVLYEKLYGSPMWTVVPHLMVLTLCMNLYVLAAFLITLNTRHLLTVYAYFMGLVCIPLSCLSHGIMLDALSTAHLSQSVPSNSEWFLHKYLSFSIPFIADSSVEMKAILVNYLIQPFLGFILSSILRLHFDNYDLLLKLVTASFMSPNIFAILGCSVDVIYLTTVLSLLLPLGCVLRVLWDICGHVFRFLQRIYQTKRQFVQNFGLNTFLETEWTRLRVPLLLRTFWITRIALLLLVELFKLATSGTFTSLMDSPSISGALWEHARIIAKELAIRGAETFIAVLGMTSIVSSVCHYVGSFFHLLLNADDEEEKSVASVSAVLFFVLALQTGITSLEPEKRFSRLCKNLYLLLTALFHFIHNMVSPVLMSLSASREFHSKKHLRALGICTFLIVAPILLMTYLWQLFTVGTWLLAVTAFCIEVIVKVTVTVSVYLLFVYDHYFKEGTWEFLDDAVYYVKAIGNTVEFCFAVFLFFNGGWILLFESGGAIRALMMVIHAYCNIWCEAKAGWQTFIKRRTAVAKIYGLPDATTEQLEEHNDVCAICYQDMISAKVTRCRHFFHGVCLRKWLYVQDTCPLCHSALYARTPSEVWDEEHPLPGQTENAPRAENRGNGQRGQSPVNNGRREDIIDNDEVDEDGDDHSNGRVVDEDDLSDGEISSEEERTDNDLIYDSMEDFGNSSGNEEDRALRT